MSTGYIVNNTILNNAVSTTEFNWCDSRMSGSIVRILSVLVIGVTFLVGCGDRQASTVPEGSPENLSLIHI